MAYNEISGITGQGRSSFGGRLKDEYLDPWEDHIHTRLVIARYLAEKRGTMGGKRQLGSVMNNYPQSAGIALFENDNMPTPRTGTYFQPELISRTIYSRLRWTGHVERAARKGKAVAWAQPRAEDLRAARKQWELNFQRMLYLGPYQVLATIVSSSEDGGTSGGDRLTLYSQDERNSQNDNRHKHGAHFLRINMSLAWVDASAGAVVPGGSLATGLDRTTAGDEFYLDAIDDTGTRPTVDTSVDLDAIATTDPGDESILIPYNSRAAVPGADGASTDSNFAGVNGLYNLIATSAVKTYVYGLSRAVVPTLSGFSVDNGSNGVRPFSEDYIAVGVDRCNVYGTGDDPDVIICNQAIRREYVKEVRGDRRFDPIIKKRGYAQLGFLANGIPLAIEEDRDCPPGDMNILESEGFGWFSEADMQMADEGERFVADKDAHEVVFVKSGNLMTRKPHNNCVVKDIEYATRDVTSTP